MSLVGKPEIAAIAGKEDRTGLLLFSQSETNDRIDRCRIPK